MFYSAAELIDWLIKSKCFIDALVQSRKADFDFMRRRVTIIVNRKGKEMCKRTQKFSFSSFQEGGRVRGRKKLEWMITTSLFCSRIQSLSSFSFFGMPTTSAHIGGARQKWMHENTGIALTLLVSDLGHLDSNFFVRGQITVLVAHYQLSHHLYWLPDWLVSVVWGPPLSLGKK